MILLHPWMLALLLLLPLPWLYLRRKEHLAFSDTRMLGKLGLKLPLHRLPLVLFSIAFCLLVVCIARPQIRQDEATQVIKSRDIVMAVDVSGSMSGQFAGEIPKPGGNTDLDKELPVKPPAPPRDDYGYYPEPGKRRIDAAEGAILNFVRNRFVRAEGDRIGIMTFDLEPRFSWPLTDDLKMIYRKGLFISEGMGGGTNFGNDDPGPIDLAVEHFDERGQAASKVMILVTDGEDYIDASAFDRLVDKLQSRGVRFYVIGIGDRLAYRDTDIIRLAEKVGGGVFRVENANDMNKVFETIDEMERSPVEVSTRAHYEDIFAIFALAGLSFLMLGLATEALVVSQ
jgi:Ca-activated chloride channel homolog